MDIEVLVVNTCSRHLPPSEAYRLVRGILRLFGQRIDADQQMFSVRDEIAGVEHAYVMLTSLIVGVILTVVYRPRTWCVFCPMGNMTQMICKLK